jgi:hypothetical protein
VKVWRRLQDVGAVALKNSVYVLPNREGCVEAFEWVAREIRGLGGQASLCDGQFFDGDTDDDIRRRFHEARNADYAQIIARAKKFLKAARARSLLPGKAATLAAQAERLRASFDAVVAQDWCDAPSRNGAETLVIELERTLAARGKPSASSEREPLVPPSGATWVTRTGVHVDRIASAWLIRAFIDPKAKFKFVPPKGYEPKRGELRFDMFDAEFTHEGDACTFEVLLSRFGIRDPALAAIGEIVHDLDLDDGKYCRSETAGVKSIVNGICMAERDDEARIAQGSAVLVGLHAAFSRGAGKASKPTRR